MIIGFTCPPSIHFKFITKCDNFITKCDRYYKVRRLLQSATEHLEYKGFEWEFRQRFQEDKYWLELSIKYVTPFVTLFTLLVFACCVVVSRSIAI